MKTDTPTAHTCTTIMEPLVLTEYGDTLNPHLGICWGDTVPLAPKGTPYPHAHFFDEPTRSLMVNDGKVGIHDHCGGWIILENCSQKYYHMCCTKCAGLSLRIPTKIVTYADLRRHFRQNVIVHCDRKARELPAVMA